MEQSPFSNIVQQLFRQPSLHAVTVDELEQVARQHPYFAAAHFLLLKKMQDTAHPGFTGQLHKTTLYFNNPLWLQFLLQPAAESLATVSAPSSFMSDEPVATAGAINHSAANAAEEKMDTTATTAEEKNTDEEKPVAATGGIMDVITDVFSDKPSSYHMATDTDEQAVSAQLPTPAITGNNEHLSGDSAIPAVTDIADTTVTTDEWALPVEGSDISADAFTGNGLSLAKEENNVTGTMIPAEPVTEESITQQPTVDYQPTVPDKTTPASNLENNFTEPVADASPAVADQTDVVAAPETEFAGAAAIKTIIETPAAKTDLLFEPYHTVDYFASQGIKLSKAEIFGKDKLGLQLRSFTEWLKVMKKLPQASIDKMLAENEESKVVADASHSIESKEVITEAMAEVFEKQGMYEKASGVYEKLSLQNPAKSAYFAAKIEALKH